jgi:serine/threonine protein kinase
MRPPRGCPEIDCWQALFGDGVPPDQRAGYERHLESCPACQDRLDLAEECEDELRRLGRRVGDPALRPADPTLVQFLDRMHGVTWADRPAAAEPADLSFLRATSRPDLLGTLGPYEVREVIGQGGMGIVLKAFDPALHRVVAIKVLAPALAGSATARRRFTREAQAAAAVCHEHVVAVHGVQEVDGLPCLLMQYVAGESLQERLDRTGPLEVAEIVRIGLQTAQGLAAAHAQGLIHRDVKPANLLLEDGLAKVKITDFGLARMADDVGLTRAGVVTGTPEYMAPEQARGEQVDHRADLFSLGSVLYAMCSGVPPFRGSSAVAVLRQVSDQAPAPLRALNPEVLAWLEALVTRLMAKDPADRFQSAAEVASLLEGYLAHLRQPMTVRAPELPPRSPGRGRGRLRPWLRRWVGPAALALLAVLGLGLTAWFAGIPGEPDARKEAPQEYYHSFKDHPDDRQGLEVIGPDADECVKFEPAGLRITLPAGYAGPPGFHGERPDTGVVIPVGVKGDFEITAGFEILQEPAPADAGLPQTRLTLDAGVDRANNTVTTLSRRVEAGGGTQFLTWAIRWDEGEGKHQANYNSFPTQARTGRLRLVRSGSVVSYYAAEGTDGEFTLLQKYLFTGGDLEDVRLVASTGADAKAALDGRFTDVRIHAAALMNVPEAPPRKAGGKGWLTLVLASALALTLALGVGIAVARGRVPRKTPALPAVAKEPDKPEAPAPFVAVSCPGCGKNLRARAKLAGKKVKCPGCGQAVLVPGAEITGRGGAPE